TAMLTELWNTVASGQATTLEQRARCRLASTYAGDSARQAMELVYRHGGSTSFKRESRLAECWRDLHTVGQTVTIAPEWYPIGGRVYLGMDPGPRLRSHAPGSRRAAVAPASRRRTAMGALSSRTRARTEGGAVSGLPASNGGAGAYSICSWITCAISGPTSSAATLSAKSMPAVTPAQVMTFPSRTTRPGSGIAPNGTRRSRQSQWQAARLPRHRPGAPRPTDPRRTQVT